jgi:hypothetical protein
MKKSFSIAFLLAVGAGCGASYPAPNDQLASAIAASRGAQEAGAQHVPRAALHLKLAEEGIVQSRAMMQNGENERAASMSLRAVNDAELALALARADAALKRSQQAAAMAGVAEKAAQ